MTPERFSGPPPLLVGVLPGQHPEVLTTAAKLAAKLSVPLLCAYVDEASYLVEWDPARSAHRLSLRPVLVVPYRRPGDPADSDGE
ncbi:MAG: hypothetical protein NVS3B6_18650 [Pseudarthrobacter sp.]